MLSPGVGDSCGDIVGVSCSRNGGLEFFDLTARALKMVPSRLTIAVTDLLLGISRLPDGWGR